jgi:flagellar basal body rod protein FlgG
MSNVANIALTALRAFEGKASVISNNIANVNMDGFKRSLAVIEETVPSGVRTSSERVNTPGDIVTMEGVERETSNVNIEEELVAIMLNKNNYDANIKTARASDEMQKTFLDIVA